MYCIYVHTYIYLYPIEAILQSTVRAYKYAINSG